MMASIQIRQAITNDVAPIASLANRWRLPYQPAVAEAAVRSAMAGESSIDQWWWERLEGVETVVAEAAGQVVGACSWATAGPEGYAYILWLEGDGTVGEQLLRYVVDVVLAKPVRAFWFATPLTLGLEGLPAGLRPEVHRALVEMGFTPYDLWLWMAIDDLPTAADEVAVTERTVDGWRFLVERNGATVAEAEVGVHGRLAVLWWIGVDEGSRRHGIGRALLRQVLALVAGNGAESCILFVDHDDAVLRDRRAALALYRSLGFRVVDHLFSYEPVRR